MMSLDDGLVNKYRSIYAYILISAIKYFFESFNFKKRQALEKRKRKIIVIQPHYAVEALLRFKQQLNQRDKYSGMNTDHDFTFSICESPFPIPHSWF